MKNEDQSLNKEKREKSVWRTKFFVVWLCPRDFSFVHNIIHICYHSYVVCLKPNVLIRGYDFCWNNVCSVLSKALYLISWDILNGCGANKRKERNSILFVRLLCNVTWESRLHKKKKNYGGIAWEIKKFWNYRWRTCCKGILKSDMGWQTKRHCIM